ncbi:helix-turn-helix domain-containing protein [Puia dinghuensis]|uniref:helix-turn-helix domain-containing protein n=1 Tax=Puia dinghuensis TaxID=1792502 RepID=UPI001E46FFDE|nr:helix-turn-helix transcriptional regulator [Puia dinghuensis]
MSTYQQQKHMEKLQGLFYISQLQPAGFGHEEENESLKADHHYKIIWVVNGSGTNWMDLEQTAITNNTLYFIKSNQAHRFQPEADLKGYVVCFTDAFLDIEDPRAETTYYNQLFTLFASARGIAIKCEIFADLLDITQKMIKEYNNSGLFRTEILRRYFKIFLLYLTRELDGNFHVAIQSRNLELVQRFLSLLDKKFKTHKKVSDYARDLVVTPNYLNDVTKKITGYSAGHNIRQRVALEAKRLGVYSNTGMKEIAYDLGFSDSAHFSKFFKTVTGMNFTDFKKMKVIVLPAS